MWWSFQALHLDVSARERGIKDLERRLQLAESSSANAHEHGRGQAESAGAWQSRCAELRSVLSEVEMAARTSAAGYTQRLLTTEASETRLAAKLEASELNSQTVPEGKQALVLAETEKAKLQEDLLQRQLEADHHCRETVQLRREFSACRAELAESLATQIDVASSRGGTAPAGFPSTSGAFATPYNLGPGRREAATFQTELMACREELAEARAGRRDAALHASDGLTLPVVAAQLATGRAELSGMTEERDKALCDLEACLDELAHARRQLQTQPVVAAQLAPGRAGSRTRAERSGMVGERDQAVSDLGICKAELAQARQRLQKSEFETADTHRNLDMVKVASQHPMVQSDELDINVAVHAAALNVAVRSELEAARKEGYAEAMETQFYDVPTWKSGAVQGRCRQPPDRDIESPAQLAADMRVRSLSSQLHAEQARSYQTTDALEASLRALREEERTVDGLRSELDVATVSCAAERATRTARTARAMSEVDDKLQKSGSHSRSKRARGGAMAQASPETLHRKLMYRSASSHGHQSMLRMRIEEEARLRLSLGLCGSMH